MAIILLIDVRFQADRHGNLLVGPVSVAPTLGAHPYFRTLISRTMNVKVKEESAPSTGCAVGACREFKVNVTSSHTIEK